MLWANSLQKTVKVRNQSIVWVFNRLEIALLHLTIWSDMALQKGKKGTDIWFYSTATALDFINRNKALIFQKNSFGFGFGQ